MQDVISGTELAEGPPAENLVLRVLAAVNATPSNAAAIASRCGLSRRATALRLSSLAKRGRIQRVGYGLFTSKADQMSQPASSRSPARPQPVRDQILAFLTEPRQAFEVAAHTGKRTATITGHMRAMLKLGLVERVGYGRYARVGLGLALLVANPLVRTHPVRDRILAFLDEPRNVTEIAIHLQRPVKTIQGHLRKMRLCGLIRLIQNQGLIRIRYNEQHPVDAWNAATAARPAIASSLRTEGDGALSRADLQERSDRACSPGLRLP